MKSYEMIKKLKEISCFLKNKKIKKWSDRKKPHSFDFLAREIKELLWGISGMFIKYL